jgi:hypothetical protein
MLRAAAVVEIIHNHLLYLVAMVDLEEVELVVEVQDHQILDHPQMVLKALVVEEVVDLNLQLMQYQDLPVVPE